MMLASEIAPIRDGLLQVGFLEDRLQPDLPIPGLDKKVPLLAFADRPFDSRTASVAVVQGQCIEDADIAALRPLGRLKCLRSSRPFSVLVARCCQANIPRAVDSTPVTPVLRQRTEISWLRNRSIERRFGAGWTPAFNLIS